MDRFSPVQTKVQITIASLIDLIGHALYDVRHHGIYLKTSVFSAFLPSTRRRDNSRCVTLRAV